MEIGSAQERKRVYETKKEKYPGKEKTADPVWRHCAGAGSFTWRGPVHEQRDNHAGGRDDGR